MGFNGSSRPRPKGELVAVLDVGTTKVVCFIGRIDDSGRPRIIGIGHQVSQGLRSGVVVDMELAERSIGSAVNAAEQMAGETIHEVLVSLSGGCPTSQSVAVDVALSGHHVAEADLRQALRSYHNACIDPDTDLVHSIPVSYAIDGNRGIRDPRGMFGENLSVELHLVTAAAGPVRNLATCITRCHLQIEAFVVSAYASGLSSLVADELELGSALIEMGGGTTGIAVFFEGNLVFTDTVPVGGQHVTNDVARGLTTPVNHAERLKTLYGNAIPNASDERELIDVPQVGEPDPAHANHVPKSLLTGIIRPRLEEIFELVRSRLEASGFDKVAGRRLVLTGGASQLGGVRDLAQLVLDKRVRMGRPRGLSGLAESTTGPAFATATGLLTHAAQHQADMAVIAGLDASPTTGLFGRLGGWIRANF